MTETPSLKDLIARESWAEAEALIRTLRRRNPADAGLAMRQAVVAGRQGEMDRVRRALATARVLAPDLPEVWQTTARLLAGDARHPVLLDRLVRIAPDDTVPATMLIQHLVKEAGDPTAAAPLLLQGLRGGQGHGAPAYALLQRLKPLRPQEPVLLPPGNPGRVMICSAADQGYFWLLHGLVSSVRAALPPDRVLLGIFDLGLSEDQRVWLAGQGARLVEPSFADAGLDAERGFESWFRAVVCRPFLPDYFPEADILIWIDADAWLQDPACLDDLIAGAAMGSLAIVPEYARAFRLPRPPDAEPGRRFGDWAKNLYARIWPENAETLSQNAILNVGVFALARNADHWLAWQETLREVLDREPLFYAEQMALNYAVAARRLPLRLLPARHNWIVTLARPAWAPHRKQLVDRVPPHDPVGILHLAGPRKTQRFSLPSLPGGYVHHYLTWQATFPEGAHEPHWHPGDAANRAVEANAPI